MSAQIPSLQPQKSDLHILYEEIKDSTYFKKISRSQGTAICHAAIERILDPGTILFRVGDVVTNVYIIKNGALDVFCYEEAEFHDFNREKQKHFDRGQPRHRQTKPAVNASCRCKAQAYFRSCPQYEGVLFKPTELDMLPESWERAKVSIDEKGIVSWQNVGGIANFPPSTPHNIKECTECECVELGYFQGDLFPIRLQFLNGTKMIFAAETKEERQNWLDRFTFFRRNRDDSVRLFLQTVHVSKRMSSGECFGHAELDQLTTNTSLTTCFHQSTVVCADKPVTLLVLSRTLYLQIIRNVEPIAIFQRLKLAQTCELFSSWNRSSLLDIAKAFVLIHTSKHEVLCRKGEPIKGVYIIYHGAVMLCDHAESLPKQQQTADPSESHTPPLQCWKTLAYGEFFGLQETLQQTAAGAFLVSNADARVFLLPTKDFHRILHLQPNALRAAYRLDPVGPVGPADDTADGRGADGAGGGGALTDRTRIFRPGACARVVHLSTSSLSAEIPGFAALLHRVPTPRSPPAGPSAGRGRPPRPPRDAAVFDRPALAPRVGPSPGEYAAAARVDLVRRQLGQSPRGCAPCDEGLLAAAREPAQAQPRPPGPAARPRGAGGGGGAARGGRAGAAGRRLGPRGCGRGRRSWCG